MTGHADGVADDPRSGHADHPAAVAALDAAYDLLRAIGARVLAEQMARTPEAPPATTAPPGADHHEEAARA